MWVYLHKRKGIYGEQSKGGQQNLVYEDIKVPDTTRDDVRGLGEPPLKLHNSF